MDTQSIFLAAIQSSFLLGLIHGVNPCGHSWLVLAPFVTGQENGQRVALLTGSFLFGTALACVLLGATLGTISMFLPPSANYWLEITTSIALLLLGGLLLFKPTLLHNHDNHHHHEEPFCHNHHHTHDHCTHREVSKGSKWLAGSLFSIGFINMIVPCPTAAIMYTFAINSGNGMAAMVVFSSYALATAISVSFVIYAIYRISTMASRLRKDWIEPLIMRSAGGIIVVFSFYGLYTALSS